MAETGTDLLKAASLLRQGSLVAIPTETVYGLAGNALDEEAVLNIFEVKERPSFDPLIVHTWHRDTFSTFCAYVPDLAYQLAEHFMPGPLTLILPRSDNIPLIVTSGNDTVGIRIPDHPLTLDLLEQLDFPLAAPSANPFGYISPTSAVHVEAQLGKAIPYILDGGPCRVGLESTIIQIRDDSAEVLRLGGLEIGMIEEAIGKKIDRIRLSASNPQAPGMLSSHYAPRKKLIVGNIIENLEKLQPTACAALTFSDWVSGIPREYQARLSPSGDLHEAARNLFSAMRKLDDLPVTYILAETVPATGLGLAINDRLQRAGA